MFQVFQPSFQTHSPKPTELRILTMQNIFNQSAPHFTIV